MKFRFALLFAAALPVAAWAKGETLSRKEMIGGCVRLREKAYECKEAFIDAMIDLRRKVQKRIARAAATEEGRAKLREIGLREITEDGSGDLAPRRRRCASVVRKSRPVERAAAQAFEACYAKNDCGERIACLMPLMKKRMRMNQRSR